MNKLNYLTTEKHAFFYKEITKKTAKAKAKRWLLDNYCYDEGKLEDGEKSETLCNRPASDYDSYFNYVDKLFQPVECENGHVMWYCYQPTENDIVYDCGAFFCEDDSDFLKEAKECSYNNTIYKVCLEDNYCVGEYEILTAKKETKE